MLPDNEPYVHGSVQILEKDRNVEDEPEVIERAEELGQEIRSRLK